MAFAANWRASSGSCAALQLCTCIEDVFYPCRAWVALEELRRACSHYTQLPRRAAQHRLMLVGVRAATADWERRT